MEKSKVDTWVLVNCDAIPVDWDEIDSVSGGWIIGTRIENSDNLDFLVETCEDNGYLMTRMLAQIAKDDRRFASELAAKFDKRLSHVLANGPESALEYLADLEPVLQHGDWSDIVFPGVYSICNDGHAEEDKEYREWLSDQPCVEVRESSGEDQFFGVSCRYDGGICHDAWEKYCNS